MYLAIVRIPLTASSSSGTPLVIFVYPLDISVVGIVDLWFHFDPFLILHIGGEVYLLVSNAIKYEDCKNPLNQ